MFINKFIYIFDKTFENMAKDIVLKAVSVGTTKQTLKDLDVNIALNRDNVNPDKLLGQPFLSRSALCHAIFTKFNENPEEALKFLNINQD